MSLTTVNFAAGEITKTVTVTVKGDTLGEPNEKYFVKLSSPIGATIADASGTGTIVNDDTSLAVNDVSVTEGNSGTKAATFTITRAGATGGASSVQWATANNTAAAGTDYVAVSLTTVNFAAGEITKTVTVKGDTHEGPTRSPDDGEPTPLSPDPRDHRRDHQNSDAGRDGQ